MLRLNITKKLNYTGRNPSSSCTIRDITQNYGISPYLNVIFNYNASQYFCTSPNINMPTNTRHTGDGAASTKGDLMKNQTVGANSHLWMNDDTIWMWQQKSPLSGSSNQFHTA